MTEGKRILYIGNKLSKKGVTVTSIETLGIFLQKEGYQVHTASSVRNKFFRLFDMLFAVLKYSRSISMVLVDTYSTQNFYFAVAVGNLCRLLRLPYVPILRGGDLPKRLEKSRSQAWKLFNGAKINVAPSMYLFNAFTAAGYTNLAYIPNTIEIDKYPFLLRKNIQPKLLWVRSFAEIYNPLLALKVLKQLREEGISCSMCMVGPEKDGSLAKCKAYAQQNELPVTFTGKLEKEEWIQLAARYDIFINTTNFDNTPVSVIEAMALGMPVISTNVGGVPFLLDHDMNGILVPPDDTESFARAIKGLLESPSQVELLTQSAREKAEGFDWQKVKHTWISLLND